MPDLRIVGWRVDYEHHRAMMFCFAFFQTYAKKAGIGTLVATMLPYTMVFLLCWTVLLIFWMLLGLPVGPGAPLYLPPG